MVHTLGSLWIKSGPISISGDDPPGVPSGPPGVGFSVTGLVGLAHLYLGGGVCLGFAGRWKSWLWMK